MVAVKLGLGAFLRCEGSGDGTLHGEWGDGACVVYLGKERGRLR